MLPLSWLEAIPAFAGRTTVVYLIAREINQRVNKGGDKSFAGRLNIPCSEI